MNPELLRNLWLEASYYRLALIAGLLLLVFAATSVAPLGLVTTSGVALGLYWFFAVLWGTRSAALSVVAEIRERTWDGQKLSSIGPWEMVAGKLFGATAANWFGAILCLPFILAPAWSEAGPVGALVFGVILLTLGLFAQAMALLSSLVLIRRQTGNWRLDTFLCQVAGILAALAYYSLWSSIPALERSGLQTLSWWGYDFNLNNFHLVSLLLFLGWALVGCWRAMRAELRFANGPFIWLAYLAYLCVYGAGFDTWLQTGRLAMLANAGPALRLAPVFILLLGSVYGMVFLEPKDPVRLHWLGEQVHARRFAKAFMALDAWMLSYGAAVLAGVLLAVVLAMNGTAIGGTRLSSLALPAAAMLGFLTRDVAVFVLMRSMAGGKGDFAALAVLAALYLLVPMILEGLNLRGLAFLFLPIAGFSILSGWAQGIGATLWAIHAIRYQDRPS
jgi:hypothetical protein